MYNFPTFLFGFYNIQIDYQNLINFGLTGSTQRHCAIEFSYSGLVLMKESLINNPKPSPQKLIDAPSQDAELAASLS